MVMWVLLGKAITPEQLPVSTGESGDGVIEVMFPRL